MSNPSNSQYKATSWGKNSEELTCPSGQVCLARRPDPKMLAEAGILDKMDMLTGMVDMKHVSRKTSGGKPSKRAQDMVDNKTLAAIAKDPKKLAEAMGMIDKVVIATVVAPELHANVPWDERDDDKVYVDTVDWEDKNFLMQFAFGGTRDLERFRREFAESIDSLDNVETLESPAK